MAIKRFNGSSFNDVTIAKRFDGTSWQALTTAKRFNGETWVDLLSGNSSSGGGSTYKAVTFTLKSKATYWGNGSKDNQYPNELLQGSYGDGLSTSRHTLLFFDNSSIASSIPAGAAIEKVELYLQRTNSAHGSEIAYPCIKYAYLSSAPVTFTGSGLKDAAETTTGLGVGAGSWITLNSTVSALIASNADICLALASGSDYSLKKYIRCGKAATKLRITYKM